MKASPRASICKYVVVGCRLPALHAFFRSAPPAFLIQCAEPMKTLINDQRTQRKTFEKDLQKKQVSALRTPLHPPRHATPPPSAPPKSDRALLTHLAFPPHSEHWRLPGVNTTPREKITKRRPRTWETPKASWKRRRRPKALTKSKWTRYGWGYLRYTPLSSHSHGATSNGLQIAAAVAWLCFLLCSQPMSQMRRPRRSWTRPSTTLTE